MKPSLSQEEVEAYHKGQVLATLSSVIRSAYSNNIDDVDQLTRKLDRLSRELKKAPIDGYHKEIQKLGVNLVKLEKNIKQMNEHIESLGTMIVAFANKL